MTRNILILGRQQMTCGFHNHLIHALLSICHSIQQMTMRSQISNDSCLAMGKDFRFLAMFYVPGIQHGSIMFSALSVIYKYERRVEFSYLSELSSCTLLIPLPFNPFTSTPKKVIWHSPITCKNNNFPQVVGVALCITMT